MTKLLRAFLEITAIKNVARAGWLEAGLPEALCESVGDHSFGVALLACLLADSFKTSLNVEKVLKMSLVHDIAEVKVGDLTPSQGIDPSEKHRRERQVIGDLLGGLAQGEQYVGLWEELEARSSPEAVFVAQVDRLEMALQAASYVERQYLGAAAARQFLDSARRQIHDPLLLAMLDEIEVTNAGREEFPNGRHLG